MRCVVSGRHAIRSGTLRSAGTGLAAPSSSSTWSDPCHSRLYPYDPSPLRLRAVVCETRCPIPPRPRSFTRDLLHPSRLHPPELASAPDARFVPAPADGVLPEGFFSTTNLPTYVKIGRRVADAARAAHGLGARARPDGELWVREGRRVKQGDRVAVGDSRGRQRGDLRARRRVPRTRSGATASSSSCRARCRARSRSTTR